MATYTGTIADLMANAGRIQAQRIREAANLQATSQQRIAEIAAAANAQRAQNNINLFGGLAQQVGGTLSDYLQYKAYSDRTKVQQQQEARAQAQFDQQQEDRALARRNDYQSQRAMMPQAAGGGPGDADFGGGPNDPGYGPPRPTPMGLPTTGLPDMPTPGGPPTAPSMGLPTAGMPGGGLPDITPTRDTATPYNHPDRLNPNREVKPTREQMLAGQPTFAHREALTKVFTAIDDQNAKRKKAEDDAKKAQQDALGVTAYGLSKFGMEPNGRLNPRALDAALEEAEASGVPVETLDQLRAGLQARPEMAGQFLDSLISRSETARAMRKDEGTDKPMAVAPGTDLFDPKTQTWIKNPNPKEAPDYTLGDSRYSGTTNQPIATNQRAVALKEAAAAAARIKASAEAGDSAASKDDTKLMMDGIVNGTLPPLLPGRASPQYVALSAEAARRGFDLAGAVTDWTATQKYIATRNGAQQTRLNQSINALPPLLDTVDELAKKWDAGRFPVLNKVSLEAAVNGAYGDEAAVIANELKAQIADVVADLGTVYMGGNSPTDHALKLAETALSADWSRPVLTKMVALARKNVLIRRNSINSTGVQGASADNPYAPEGATGGRAPLTAPPPAPPGWRYEKNAQGGWTAVQAP